MLWRHRSVPGGGFSAWGAGLGVGLEGLHELCALATQVSWGALYPKP